jgi:hypothetical protein
MRLDVQLPFATRLFLTFLVVGGVGAIVALVEPGAPHFVDFGRDMEHSPDGRAYLVGHGSTRMTNSTRLSWMSGDDVYLARTAAAPDPATVNNLASWEFFTGRDTVSGEALWVAGNVTAAKPLFTWLNRTGVVTVTYVAAIQRYLMCVSTPTVYGGDTLHDFDSYILEASDVTGPWSRVAYLASFGPEAYFLNIVSKFAAAEVVNGTLELWLSYSANFAAANLGPPNAPFSGYSWVLQKIRVGVAADCISRSSRGCGGDPRVVGLAKMKSRLAAVPPGQNTSTYAAIINTSFALLESHTVIGERWGMQYHFYKPALEKYSSSQWLWDSGSHMIAWSHRNVTNAILDLRTMLQMQEPDGA